MADFSLLRSPDFAQAYATGAALGKRRRVDEALSNYAADPEGATAALIGAGAVDQAAALDKIASRQRRSAALSAVFTPSGVAAGADSGAALYSGAGRHDTPAIARPGYAPAASMEPAPGRGGRGGQTLGDLMRSGRLPGYGVGTAAASSTGDTPTGNQGMPPASEGGPIAPATVVDPARLPPRTDGIQLNQDALRRLYMEDPETAHQLQSYVFQANKQQMETAKRHAAVMGNVALHLRNLPVDQRAAELGAFVPQLREAGFSDSDLSNADLSDAGLSRYMAMAQDVHDLLADDRAERRLAWDRQDDEADNARADRNTDSVISDRNARRGLVARGQNMTDARVRRGQDLSSGDRQRGQDMEDKRYRDGGQGGTRRPAKAGSVPVAGGPLKVSSKAAYDALPSGTVFVAPDGTTKRKP